MDEQRKHRIARAASVFGEPSITDDELANAIEIAEEVLTFLEARGSTWALAADALRRDLGELHGFRLAREQQTPRGHRP